MKKEAITPECQQALRHEKNEALPKQSETEKEIESLIGAEEFKELIQEIRMISSHVMRHPLFLSPFADVKFIGFENPKIFQLFLQSLLTIEHSFNYNTDNR